MLAWYHSRSSKQAKVNRAMEIVAEGGLIEFPPVRHADFLIWCAEDCGLSRSGPAGLDHISAQELSSWAGGTATELGPMDFQDLLDASRAYVSAWRGYDEKLEPPPWQRDMTEEEAEQVRKAEERYFDMLMGVRAPIGSDQTQGT